MMYVIRAVDPVDNRSYYWSDSRSEWMSSIDDATQYAWSEANAALQHAIKWYSHQMSWFQLMSA